MLGKLFKLLNGVNHTTLAMESGMILVVDDEMSIRRALHTTLSNLGFKTVEAARGEEALSLLRTNIFDAVLLDIKYAGHERHRRL